MKNINGENLMAVHTHTHTLFVTRESVKLFLNKIASVLVEEKNNKEANNLKDINNKKDRLFYRNKVACLF